MTAFWFGAAALVVLAWLLLLPAWRIGAAPVGKRGAHLGILAEQLGALDLELADGRIDAAQHQFARHEVQRRVLDESQADAAPLGNTGSRHTVVLRSRFEIGAASRSGPWIGDRVRSRWRKRW